MTESQAERNTNYDGVSPELGLSFDRVSLQEAVESLDVEAKMTQATELFALRLGALGEFFATGMSQGVWRRYVAVADFDIRSFENAPNAEQVQAKYAALVREAAAAPILYVEDQLKDLNDFITANPGLVMRDTDTSVSLEQVGAAWYDDGKTAIPKIMPLTQTATWSDGSVQDIAAGAILYVDLPKAPAEIQRIVRQSADV